MRVRKALEKDYSLAQVWVPNTLGCKRSGPNTETIPGSGLQGFALELGPEPRNWGKSRLEMDSAPLKYGDVVWTLSVGGRLRWLAVGWIGWRGLASIGPTKLPG